MDEIPSDVEAESEKPEHKYDHEYGFQHKTVLSGDLIKSNISPVKIQTCRGRVCDNVVQSCNERRSNAAQIELLYTNYFVWLQ